MIDLKDPQNLFEILKHGQCKCEQNWAETIIVVRIKRILTTIQFTNVIAVKIVRSNVPTMFKGEVMTKNEEREEKMFGCREAELKESVENSLTFKLSGPAMVAASMMSDAQEELLRGMNEEARQTLNRAKFVLFEYVSPRERAERG